MAASSGASRAGRGDLYVALLRGINLGGKNRLSMSDLVLVFQELGCVDVQTYIQSGNVVFRATRSLAPRVPDLVARSLSGRFGLSTPVVLRSGRDLRAVVERNPFLASRADPGSLHVAFLADRPAASRIASLEPDRSPPDAFAVAGREIYLRLPHGMARTKLTNQYFDSRLGTVSTMRNWRTVLRLVELAAP